VSPPEVSLIATSGVRKPDPQREDPPDLLADADRSPGGDADHGPVLAQLVREGVITLDMASTAAGRGGALPTALEYR